MTSSPGKSTQQLVATIDALGKVARQKDLLRHGFTPWNSKQALEAGTVAWISRGYYALPDADSLDVELARHQARRACFTKAEQLGLWVITPMSQPHVAAAHGRPIPGYVVHTVSGGQTLLESAVVLKKCTFHELREAFSGRKDTAGRAIVAMIDPQSQSIAETVARSYLLKAGYNVQCQVAIKGVGHLDLLVEGILGVETDGQRYHNTPAGWAEDLRRDNLLVIEGIWKLRIPAAVVLYHPNTMLRWVKDALAQIAAG